MQLQEAWKMDILMTGIHFLGTLAGSLFEVGVTGSMSGDGNESGDGDI